MVVATSTTMRRSLAYLAFLLAWPTVALAQPEESEQPTTRARPGTHFIGELDVGTHVQGAGSFTWGGMLGFGGKPRGIPATFYLVAGAFRTHDTQTLETNATRYSYDLKLTDVDFGLRAYFPVARGFRITTEAMLGATLADGELSESSDYRTNQNLSMPHLMLGIGPQFRVIHELSFGVMARTMFVDTGNVRSTGALSSWKDPLGRRSQVVGTITFHW